MRNKLSDLQNHLFIALERVNDEDLKGEELLEEISRNKSITAISQQIIANGDLVLKATEMSNEIFGRKNSSMPDFIGVSVGDVDGKQS